MEWLVANTKIEEKNNQKPLEGPENVNFQLKKIKKIQYLLFCLKD